MFSKLAKFILFVSSYFPLFVILAVQYWESNLPIALTFLGVGGIGLAGMFACLRMAGRVSPLPIQVTEIKARDEAALSYIVTYIVPFLVQPSDSPHKVAAMAIFFLVVALLYMNVDLVHINPMLSLVGYRLYDVTLLDGSSWALLSRRRIIRGDRCAVVEVGERIYVERQS